MEDTLRRQVLDLASQMQALKSDGEDKDRKLALQAQELAELHVVSQKTNALITELESRNVEATMRIWELESSSSLSNVVGSGVRALTAERAEMETQLDDLLACLAQYEVEVEAYRSGVSRLQLHLLERKIREECEKKYGRYVEWRRSRE